MTRKVTNMNIRKVLISDKKAITKDLESMIKKHGLDKVKTVVNHYFKNYLERQKAAKKVAELRKEIASLEKKL